MDEGRGREQPRYSVPVSMAFLVRDNTAASIVDRDRQTEVGSGENWQHVRLRRTGK